MSHNAVIYKALFSKFCLIICAEVFSSHNMLSPRLFDMHSFASAERRLSAGTRLDASAR